MKMLEMITLTNSKMPVTQPKKPIITLMVVSLLWHLIVTNLCMSVLSLQMDSSMVMNAECMYWQHMNDSCISQHHKMGYIRCNEPCQYIYDYNMSRRCMANDSNIYASITVDLMYTLYFHNNMTILDKQPVQDKTAHWLVNVYINSAVQCSENPHRSSWIDYSKGDNNPTPQSDIHTLIYHTFFTFKVNEHHGHVDLGSGSPPGWHQKEPENGYGLISEIVGFSLDDRQPRRGPPTRNDVTGHTVYVLLLPDYAQHTSTHCKIVSLKYIYNAFNDSYTGCVRIRLLLYSERSMDNAKYGDDHCSTCVVISTRVKHPIFICLPSGKTQEYVYAYYTDSRDRSPWEIIPIQVTRSLCSMFLKVYGYIGFDPLDTETSTQRRLDIMTPSYDPNNCSSYSPCWKCLTRNDVTIAGLRGLPGTDITICVDVGNHVLIYSDHMYCDNGLMLNDNSRWIRIIRYVCHSYNNYYCINFNELLYCQTHMTNPDLTGYASILLKCKVLNHNDNKCPLFPCAIRFGFKGFTPSLKADISLTYKCCKYIDCTKLI